MKIGVIGLGAMGSRMAKNFMETGYEVFVCNRTKARAKELIDMGAIWCDTPKALAEASDIIMTILTDDEASRSVWLDSNTGAVLGLGPDKVAIECSTISHQWALKLSSELQTFNYLEAPLVGSRPQVESKQLTILVGGHSEVYEKVRSLFECTSAKVSFVGEYGKAIALKLVINSLLGIQTAAFAELYSALLCSGFKKKQVMNILPQLPVTAPIMQMMLSLFAEEKFAPLFPIELMKKDFSYAEKYIEDSGVKAHVVASTYSIYARAAQSGFGEQNISGILNFYKSRE